MTHDDFVAGAKEVVENYWRIRASLKLLAPTPTNGRSRLQFEGIPAVGSMSGLLQNETIDEARASLDRYASSRLARDLFIALIAVLERRFSARLIAANKTDTGTLGALQHAIERIATVPIDVREDFNEVRERRNALMHSDGRADDKYVDAANRVRIRSTGFVAAAARGDLVIPDGAYLTYAADVLTRYSASI